MKLTHSRTAIALASMLALTLTIACGQETPEEAATPETTGTWITGEPREPIPDATAGQTVIVAMNESSLAMPTTVTPGPTVFTITNAGAEPHQLMIQGASLQSSLPSPIPPGGTDGLDAELPEGKMQAWCSIEGHRERGEWAEFTVAR